MFPGRYGQPEEVAGVVEFLAINPAANYMTGQVLHFIAFTTLFMLQKMQCLRILLFQLYVLAGFNY